MFFLKLIRDKFLRNGLILVAGSTLTGFLGYFFHFVISRKLSIEQYGELQGLLSVLVISSVFSASLSNFVVKYSSVFAKAKDYYSNKKFVELLRFRVVRLSAILFLLFLFLTPLIGKVIRVDKYLGLIVIAGAIAFSLNTVVYQRMLTGWEEFGKVSSIGVFGVFMRLLIGFLIASFYPSASAVVFAFLLAGIARFIFSKILCQKKYLSIEEKKGDLDLKVGDWQGKYFSKMNIRKSIVPIFIFSLTLILVSNVDVILVKNLTSAELTGHYGALSVLGKIVLWFNMAIVGVIFPTACANGQKGEGISQKMLIGVYGLVLTVSLLIAIFYFLFPVFLVNLFFGSKYLVFHDNLWIFAIMALALSLLTLEANLAYARHDFKISYILVGVVLVMILSVYFFHSTIYKVVVAVTFSFLIGYLATLMNGFFSKKLPKKS